MIQVPLTNSDEFAIVDDQWKEDVLCQKWLIDNHGYARTSTKTGFKEYQYLKLHSVIMGEKPEFTMDHISGDKLDNRESNLRFVTASQQRMNTKIPVHNKSGVKGVCYTNTEHRDRRWMAHICVDGHRQTVGRFLTFEEACAARKEAEQKLHGGYTRKSS